MVLIESKYMDIRSEELPGGNKFNHASVVFYIENHKRLECDPPPQKKGWGACNEKLWSGVTTRAHL